MSAMSPRAEWVRPMLVAALLAVCACGGAEERVRAPVVAGTFYEASAAKLRAEVDGHLAKGATKGKVEGHPVALIAPHAGYQYSGACAGAAYATVKGKTYKRVIILAVNHRGAPFRGGSILDVDAYRTPLGTIAVDRDACEKLLKTKLIDTHRSAHSREHSLEVQLPFLQRAIGAFKLVPIVVSRLRGADFANMAAALRTVVDDDTLVVASSDFTHFGRAFGYVPFYKDVRANIEKLDKGAIDFALKRDGKGFWSYVGRKQATICGRCPITVLLYMLPEGAKGTLLDYYTSGDANKDYRHSVSYAAIAFTSATRWRGASSADAALKPIPGAISPDGQRALLRIARKTLIAVTSGQEVPALKLDTPELQSRHGVFVTLEWKRSLGKRDRLRGCIGNFRPRTPLYQTVAQQTYMAARRDTRFRPVTAGEVKDLEIEISILLPAEVIKDPLDWELGTHGIIVQRAFRSATYLPQVAEHFEDKTLMLSRCCRKAGLPEMAWNDPSTTVKRYRAQVFGEAGHETAP